MEYIKQKRIKDRKLLKETRLKACSICARKPPSDCCHIKTRGSGGDDVEDNVFPACRKCHITQGAYGFEKMFALYPSFRKLLKDKGWEFEEGRLRRTRAYKGREESDGNRT